MNDLKELLTKVDAAIKKADPENDGAFTSSEYALARKKTQSVAYRELKEARRQGLIKAVMAPKKNDWGVVKMTQCYKLVEAD